MPTVLPCSVRPITPSDGARPLRRLRQGMASAGLLTRVRGALQRRFVLLSFARQYRVGGPTKIGVLKSYTSWLVIRALSQNSPGGQTRWASAGLSGVGGALRVDEPRRSAGKGVVSPTSSQLASWAAATSRRWALRAGTGWLGHRGRERMRD